MNRNVAFKRLMERQRSADAIKETTDETYYIWSLGKSIAKVHTAFTKSSIEEEQVAMVKALENVFQTVIIALKNLGAPQRRDNPIIAYEPRTAAIEEVHNAIEGERNYEDSEVAKRYGSEGRVFSLEQEIIMIQDYYNDEVTAKILNHSFTEVLHGFRKIGAMALRSLEDHGHLLETEMARAGGRGATA